MKNNKPVKVLDKGFVRLVDTMGDDTAVVDAARCSYKNSKKKRSDKALINYLMRNHHTSPFEMSEIKLHIKAPLFITRQWLRHRTASVNELSARYSIIEDDFYFPDLDKVCVQSDINKQSPEGGLTTSQKEMLHHEVVNSSEAAYECYERLLAPDDLGNTIARETARIVLPVNIYTEFYWKIDVNNLLKFLRSRLDYHAQFEIREYAQVIADIFKEWMPYTWEAFNTYHLEAKTLSYKELSLLNNLVTRSSIEGLNYDMSDGEVNELIKKLNL